jgi:two-component system phosphate regulon sensor histidine kinase PhoR
MTSQEVLALHTRAAGGEACQSRVRLSLSGQPRYYEVSAIPVRLSIADIPARVSPRRGVVLTFRDVHDLAQTLRLRTDFAANASHELRTPIASIKTAIETMQGPAADDAAMQDKLRGMIENNIIRLEETVNDLLDLSRLESEGQASETGPVDAAALCDELTVVFEQVCERRNLLLEYDLDPALSRMVSDRKLLLLVLRNLVDNATKFAFEGTTVRVTGEVLPAAGAGRAGARFRVIDLGIGIPLKHQARVFERFFQVDESRARLGGRRGSGLGLAIVRHALRGVDGEITIDSVWQEGTTMTVTIPACVESDTARDNPGDQPPAGA